MLILLSPAKLLDFESPMPTTARTLPRLLDQAEELAEVLKTKSVSDLARLSSISDELAALNAQRWADFAVPYPRAAARPAVLAFNGEAYRGLDVRGRFDTRDYTEAQKTLRILSGLYGLLRPLDLILAYRLEMGSRLVTERGANLYRWWGSRITDQLRADLAESPGAPIVVNLTSAEYFRAVSLDRLEARVISPRFEDTDARGRRKVLPFFTKHSRGAMAAWLIKQRVRSPHDLLTFQAGGYRYDPAASTPDEPVFVRAFADRD